MLFAVGCNASPPTPVGKEALPEITTPNVGTVNQAATVASDYRSAVLSDGAVGYWRLGELPPNTGNLAHDEATPPTNGTYVGTFGSESPLATLNQAGAISTSTDRAALFFISNNQNRTHNPPGQSTWVTVPHRPYQAPTKMSLETWFTMTPGASYQTYSALFHKSTANMQDGYGIFYYNYGLYFWINNGGSPAMRISVPIPAPGVYHHIVATYGGPGTPMKLYLDGALVASGAPGGIGTINAGTAPLWIGKGWLALGWQGLIDEPAMYNTVLTQDQVVDHYNRALGSKYEEECEAKVVSDAPPNTELQTRGVDIKMAQCLSPNISSCKATVLGSSNFDNRTAAQQYMAKTISPAQHLAIVRDRERKVNSLLADAPGLAAYCSGDADGDFVADNVDQCPGTPPLTPTNNVGCPDTTPLPTTPPREAIDKVLNLMGQAYDKKCTNALTPAVPVVKSVCESGTNFKISFTPSTNEPSGCQVWYRVDAQLKAPFIQQPGETQEYSNFAFGPGQFGSHPPELPAGPNDITYDVTFWKHFEVYTTIRMQAVNGNGTPSAWSDPVTFFPAICTRN